MVSEKQFCGQAVQALVFAAAAIYHEPIRQSGTGRRVRGRVASGAKALVKDEAYYLAEAPPPLKTAISSRPCAHYSKVLEFNPQNAAAWTGQVRMLDRAGRIPRSQALGGQGARTFPQRAGTAGRQGRGARPQRRFAGRAGVFRRLHRGARRHPLCLAGPRRRAAGARGAARGLLLRKGAAAGARATGSSPGWRRASAITTSSLRWP